MALLGKKLASDESRARARVRSNVTVAGLSVYCDASPLTRSPRDDGALLAGVE